MIRVIGGFYKGRVLKTGKKLSTRPTPSIVREALFDIIGEKIEGATFLDLYAGFGSVGIESISRGASYVLFVEKDFSASKTIKENLNMLGIKGGSDVICLPVEKSLKTIQIQKIKWDFIFLDPPFKDNPYPFIIEKIEQRGILNEGGKVIIQHQRRFQPEVSSGLIVEREYSYGDNLLLFLKRSLE